MAAAGRELRIFSNAMKKVMRLAQNPDAIERFILIRCHAPDGDIAISSHFRSVKFHA